MISKILWKIGWELMTALSLIACGNIGNERRASMLVGKFERPVNTEFSRGRIQLVIRHKTGKVYTIEKYSETAAIRNGKESPVQYDTAVWTGTYDDIDHVIYEHKTGKVISFEPEDNKLRVGGMEYTKTTN